MSGGSLSAAEPEPAAAGLPELESPCPGAATPDPAELDAAGCDAAGVEGMAEPVIPATLDDPDGPAASATDCIGTLAPGSADVPATSVETADPSVVSDLHTPLLSIDPVRHFFAQAASAEAENPIIVTNKTKRNGRRLYLEEISGMSLIGRTCRLIIRRSCFGQTAEQLSSIEQFLGDPQTRSRELQVLVANRTTRSQGVATGHSLLRGMH